MIVRLTGTLADVSEDSIVVEREGVAREILVPHFAVAELAAYRGQQVTLHTMQFYEGNHSSGNLVPRMLGFLHPEDRLFFERFVSVKGIGPKKALKALCEPVRRIASWIEAGDGKELSRLPGIGKRVAELVIATLRGKMDDLAMTGATSGNGRPAQFSSAQRDALEVLVAWGDGRGECERWLERAAQLHPDIGSAGEWVRAAYRIKAGMEG
jgi:Holliday junction DNA helicase RuvA